MASRSNTSRRTVLTALLAGGLSVPLLGAAPASSAPAAVLALPSPSGHRPVGRRTLHLVDRHRADPWVPTARGRELMVSVSYPARPSGGAPAAYMTESEAQRLLEAKGLAGVVPATTVAGTRTHARADAPPAPGCFPLVLLSPGFSMPRTTLTALAGELAAGGYVAAAVDHAYESVGTEFPGGRVPSCVACDRVGADVEEAAVVQGRAADLSFVIDELTGHRRAGALARVIDAQRIGVAGHSIGGAAAMATMAADRRVRAGVNLDGGFFVRDAGSGLGRRPFMMVGAEDVHGPAHTGSDWAATWGRLRGWKRWLTVAGAGHFSFTDIPWLADRLGLADPEVPLSGERGWYITRDYVRAFFDLHLRGIPQPLLQSPTSAHPEVEFHRP
ncbi:alpha/beta hydrolase family protein [Streptomyces ardesiacus]|uniref:alpha/beta hydrolase family protein n=1 Tax=Streptomyces ardesiacus TaxID=285564 RepID=UPI00201F83D1|nr:alpha/beta hydrolase [Streptomyces ardesiacus]MCL7368826.1 alpha/beta hydrolase [Streptomyces ardesiacus]